MASYDVIIIGGGPGGYVAAERLGARKKKVLLIEKVGARRHLPQRGLHPDQDPPQLRQALRPRPRGREVRRKGAGASYDWTAMQAWKREVVEKLRGGIALTEKRLGVEVLSAEARLLGPGRVEARDASGAATLHDARARHHRDGLGAGHASDSRVQGQSQGRGFHRPPRSARKCPSGSA